jgi:hypothetical protein
MGCAGSKKADGVAVDDVKLVKKPQESEAEKAAKAAKAEELKQQAAACKLQAIHRGNADRYKVELMKHACDNYRVNMQAEEFGQCMCGWAKAAHTPEALAKKGKKEAMRKVGSQELRDKFVKKEKCSCERYEVNMQSANFGECVCGEAKSEHTAEALAAGEQAKAARVDSAEMRSKFVQKETAACKKYEVLMGDNSVSFGTCVCGRPRAEHSEAALAAAAGGGKGTTRMDSGEVRAKFVQKEYAECEEYEVLVGDNSVAFGTCVCGRPRSEHSPDALQAGANKAGKSGKRESAEVRKGFAKTAAWSDREVCDCKSYKVDMDPGVPFGQCVCGQPKAMHSDEAISGRQ